ncbi:hypothetical protein Hanom_Chr06g00554071 [Helianthus anomalus]
MALSLKPPHNYIPYLVKTYANTEFHSIIDIITLSKYQNILIADAPIHLENIEEFWAKSDFLLHDKKPSTIISTINGVAVQITPELISTTFSLNDDIGSETFQKTDLHNEFIERGYDGQMAGAAIFKPYFSPAIKFFFHTLLILLSPKTTTYNEIYL